MNMNTFFEIEKYMVDSMLNDIIKQTTINTFAAGLNQVVHAKTAGSHMALRGHNSGTLSAKELFKRAKRIWSLVICNEK